ncbi:MAG: LysR family transcriptional regulator [Lachnospiraceae bacterium]|nr:LysR family transcriptional regulator [Lachnospiraceae bacterium]
MNFLSMEYFTTVANEKSFTKAAEKLHITQQTLSSHIANIEKEVGCRLFVRHIPLELTYAGQVFLQYAADFRQKYASMMQEFQDISENQKGILRIGIAYTRGRTIMPMLIEKFLEIHPYYEVRLVEDSNEMLQKYVLNGDVDLAIANFPESIPGIELHPFYFEEIVLLIARPLLEQLYGEETQHTIRKIENGDLSVLQNCPFVLGSPDDITGSIGRHFLRQANLTPVVKAQSDNVETILSMCVRGIGACFCPENLMKMTLSKSQISRLRGFRLSGAAKYQIRFGVLQQNYQWNAISEFMKIAVEAFPGS